MTHDKITDRHLQRSAYVYIRQSSLQQVRNNRESNQRQYALEERARELGFKKVEVIDEDLGITGSGQRERPGFSRLLSLVCNGEAGGVFALEASRLARNNRDWHHLIDLCVLTETVVVDAEGVYDPRLLDDRLLLGLKGTMSEFELGILRQRAQEAYRRKVLRGEVLTRVPIGYVREGGTGIAMTPDREVQEALRTFFAQFSRLGTLRQVLLWYHQEKVYFPVQRNQDVGATVEWQLPGYQQLLRILKNPTYAGAFAYGRTGTRTKVIDGRSRKSSGHKVSMDEWQVLINDHHSGYISWEQYMENQRILASNRTKSHPVDTGAARNGTALLAGLLRCAKCGNKLHVKYRGSDGRAPRYLCSTGNSAQEQATCLTFGGIRFDQAIVKEVIEACQPLAIEASIQAMDTNCVEHENKRRALELALERTRYEAERAHRQYNAVDPENRLVSAELEARWNAALVQVAEADERLRTHCQAKAELNQGQRERLLELGTNLQEVWDDPVTPIELKKRIIRSVITEIVVDVNDESSLIEMRIHWAGGVHTLRSMRKNRPGLNCSATDKNIVELVQEWAKAWSDAKIAGILNRLGFSTGPGNSWNETRVKNLRLYNKIPVFSQSSKRSWITMSEAAEKLEVSMCVIRTMIKRDLLPARQPTKGAPWMIERKDLNLSCVKAYAKSAHTGKPAPCEDNNQIVISYQ